MNAIQFICFSRARPLQLHAYLTSLFHHWQGDEQDLRVVVLARVDAEYEQAYGRVADEFVPRAHIFREDNFAQQVLELIDPRIPYTSFGCDDVVFVWPLPHGAIVGQFDYAEKIIGVSLRLGLNVTRDMFAVSLPQPEFVSVSDHRIVWDVLHGKSLGDWAYPFEVLGTVYPTTYARKVVEETAPPSPSQLEYRGAQRWREWTDAHHMAAFATSRLLVPTVNVVQTEFPNGIRGPKALAPEFLLECWDNDMRVDTAALIGQRPPSWRVADFPLRRMAA